MKPRFDPSGLTPSQDLCPALFPRPHPRGSGPQDLLYPGLAAYLEESTFSFTGAPLISTSSTCGNTEVVGREGVVMGPHQRDFRCLKTHCSCIPLSLPSSRLNVLCYFVLSPKDGGFWHHSQAGPQRPLLNRSVRILVANDECKHCVFPSPNTSPLSN